MGKPAEETSNEVNNEKQVIITDALKAGKRVRRDSWPTGTFVFRQVPSTIAEDVIPKMTSLPEAVKVEFQRRGGSISYDNQLAIVNASNEITGYFPTAEDLLAPDWRILE